MKKPYKYDEWLKTHTNEQGIVDMESVLSQYVGTVSKLQKDRSNSMVGVINNASLYVNYFINELQQLNG